jgi:hypothetical protein
MDLPRSVLGVRVGYVLLCVASYFGTLLVLAHWPALDQAGTMSSLQWLVGAIGVAVAGDSLRPSGQRASAFHVVAASQSTDDSPAPPAAS